MRLDSLGNALAACAAAGLLLAAAPAAPAQPDNLIRLTLQQVAALGIETGAIAAQPATGSTPLPAVVVVPPAQQRIVAAPLGGLLERLLVAANEPVRAGQALARLQSPGMVEAQRALLQAATQHELARRNLARDSELQREGIIAESRYLAAQGAQAEAAAALAERRQMLRLYGMSEAALERLLQTRSLSTAVDLVSPLDGVVLEVLAAPGQRLEAAAPVARVARLSPLWLEVQLPVARIGGVSPGARVAVAGDGASGRVLSVGSAVHPENQTVAVRAEITKGAAGLRPGQSVEAVVDFAHQAARQWQVPAGALARIDGRPVVFVAVAGGFRALPVTLVEETAAGPCVAGALRGDERIAVRGVAALKARLTGVGRE